MAKLNAEKCEAQEKLEDVLEEIQIAVESLSGPHDPKRQYLEVILNKCPEDWRHLIIQRMNSNIYQNGSRGGSAGMAYTEKSFVRMHKSINRATQTHHRTNCQWELAIKQAMEWEDVARNETSISRYYKPSITTPPSSAFYRFIRETIYTPTIEWYWRCMLRGTVYKCLGYFLTALSLTVVWSEMTFSILHPPISIFALLIGAARSSYSYFLIEVCRL